MARTKKSKMSWVTKWFALPKKKKKKRKLQAIGYTKGLTHLTGKPDNGS